MIDIYFKQSAEPQEKEKERKSNVNLIAWTWKVNIKIIQTWKIMLCCLANKIKLFVKTIYTSQWVTIPMNTSSPPKKPVWNWSSGWCMFFLIWHLFSLGCYMYNREPIQAYQGYIACPFYDILSLERGTM